ncbi:MAG: Flp pilus assembly complex ATPase component TadA, partial [Methylocaldum sp.]|nr:Flp pilus assembly complex ATPase component TadA [Methylocaldum sp.]
MREKTLAIAPQQLNPPATYAESIVEHPYERFADELVRRGKVREAEIHRAKRLAAQADEQKLPALLARLGIVSERDTAEILAEVGSLPLVSPADYPDTSPLPDTVAIRFLKENHVVGIAAQDNEFIVAVADPFDRDLLAALALACEKPVRPYVGLPSEIDRALEQQLGSGKTLMGQIVEDLGSDEEIDEADVEHLKDLASEAPVIRMVNLIMQRAVESRASDIHVEPFEQRLKVRFRVDGVLREVEAPPVRSTAAVISRIKIMAKLNIAERRLPQ